MSERENHQHVHEARIVRAVAPRRLRLWRLRRWGWTVTRYAAVDGPHPGVADRRVHLWTESGHTFTWWGAARAVADEVTRRGDRA